MRLWLHVAPAIAQTISGVKKSIHHFPARNPDSPISPTSPISPGLLGSFWAACGCMCIWLVSFPFSSFPFDWLVGWSGHVSLCGVYSVIYLSVPRSSPCAPRSPRRRSPKSRDKVTFPVYRSQRQRQEQNAPLIF